MVDMKKNTYHPTYFAADCDPDLCRVDLRSYEPACDSIPGYSNKMWREMARSFSYDVFPSTLEDLEIFYRTEEKGAGIPLFCILFFSS